MTTQTNGDDCRESGERETSNAEFEKFFKGWHPDRSSPYLKDIMRQVWQASRTAISIELHETMFYEEIVQTLTNAGINARMSDGQLREPV